MNYIILLGVLCCSIATAIRPDTIHKFDVRDGQYNYRLPNNTKPEAYDLTLKTYLDKNEFNFDGLVKIKFRVLEPTSEIKLHYRLLEINTVKILGHELSSTEHNTFTDIFTIKTKNELKKGKVYSLIIDYKGDLNYEFGFFRTYFTDFNGNKR